METQAMTVIEPPMIAEQGCSIGRTVSITQGRKTPAAEFPKLEVARPARPPMIGLCGYMGSGKDTVGALLTMIGYEMIAFADALKREAYRALMDEEPWPGEQRADLLNAWETCRPSEIYAKPTSPAARTILQYWGTEYRRAQNVQYWVNALANSLRPGVLYVITDMRFANEAQFVHANGGQVWMVDRFNEAPGIGITGHSSEKFEGVYPDLSVVNKGDLKALAAEVRRVLDDRKRVQ